VHLAKHIVADMVARDEGRDPVHVLDRFDHAGFVSGRLQRFESFVQSALALRTS
jgi:hypothetical protein